MSLVKPCRPDFITACFTLGKSEARPRSLLGSLLPRFPAHCIAPPESSRSSGLSPPLYTGAEGATPTSEPT